MGIATAWFATQDGGDAAAAAANTCDASALAYAALQYEQAHGSPNGPLPHITRQVCAGGAAIAVFIQEVPTPGYEASIAYLASPSGWQVSGMSDFIEPGQFGIPAGAYEEIMSTLTGEPDSESVDF